MKTLKSFVLNVLKFLLAVWPLTLIVTNIGVIWIVSGINWDLSVKMGVWSILFYVGLGVLLFVLSAIRDWWLRMTGQVVSWEDLTYEERAYIKELDKKNAQEMIRRGEVPQRLRKFIK